MKDKKYFCYEIYKNLAIWSLNGRLAYSPCSFFRGYIKTNDRFDLSEVWNSPEHLQLKHLVENNIPITGCQRCYDEENCGLTSRRMAARQLYEEYHNDITLELDGPQGLDYSVGNLCNLKCVICKPKNSSAWIPDYQKLHPDESVERFLYQKFNQIEIDSPAVLKNVVSIHFHGGGEPLMSSNHINLLKKIQKIRGLSDVRVYYNVNGTQKVSQEILNLWEKCKLVELYFSIDDIGARFDYQRTNAVWENVKTNLKWYQDNMPHNHMFNINCVWSYLNFYYLPELVDWHRENFVTNRYGDPVNLIFQRAIGPYNITHLSAKTKQALQERFSDYPELQELLRSVPISELPQHTFWKEIIAIDTIRQANFRQLCPDWSALL
jgi:MoaA/NifB/PqqE/SkfB family radical SAM enzyme